MKKCYQILKKCYQILIFNNIFNIKILKMLSNIKKYCEKQKRHTIAIFKKKKNKNTDKIYFLFLFLGDSSVSYACIKKIVNCVNRRVKY